MAAGFNEMLTGNDVIDTLRGVQVMADNIADPNKKVAYVRRGVVATRIHELLGTELMLSVSRAFLRTPDNDPRTRFMLQARIIFSGDLAAVSYMLDPEIPVDALTLNFEGSTLMHLADSSQYPVAAKNPELVPFDVSRADSFKDSTLQVPILAIESCVNA